ncbi:hypothetical protein [Haloferax sp. DFSO52]|uniref:hypothetical protein n=1 Tax=Haloferax sp. DFSO52 TaxID=3388505 RepID=UPI003A8A6C7F
MKRITLLGVVLAVLVATAGVAAAAPGDRADEQHGNDAAQQGPPSELPEQVPDFVSDIHDTINEFLDGALDGTLGPAVSDHAGQSTASSDAAN